MGRVAAIFLGAVFGLLSGCEAVSPICGRCESKVVQQEPDRPPRLISGQCMINGVPIDCRKHHTACPDCVAKK